MCAHQVILGETVDFITGETIVDTLDERARQTIARFLVEEKGYSRGEIEVGQQITLTVDGNRGTSRVDFLIRVAGKAFMIIIFGPGSLVSRERSTVAAARLIENHEVPFAVVTNGQAAEVLETRSGKVIAEGLQNIPSKAEALRNLETITFEKLSEERLEREKRIRSAKNNFPFSHLSFGLSLADTHSQNPRNSLLFLWLCSIESTKSNPNLSANSAKLFFAEPLAPQLEYRRRS
ncbi:MAG: type I restriction enzyme HsdR N-terminal domain-containing protein [Deltaproteobacteria bacterium]|nr:type I restriction enzyme HsdR N-terminal domain-containing protein [Deltaproteobacteria bacterium]